MPLIIIRNDITHVAADAIVNTANPHPCVGAGTDQAIHEAAGPALLEARREIGAIPVGSCAVTPAFGLPAKYVLHTVSPSWNGGGQREAELLRRAYDAALAQAERLGCASVAFPLMAAGSYGFPQDIALSVAIQAFTDHLMTHDAVIYLVLYNRNAFGLASSIFDGVKSYIDDTYVMDREDWSDRLPSSRRRQSAMRNAEATCFDMSASAAPPPASAPAAMAGGLAELLRQSESTFSEFLLDLLREREGKDSEVYKRAEISKQLFSKILSTKDYQPTKSTAIQLAIGLQLDLPQTQKLLGKAGFALTRSSKTDLVVQYYIERKVYSVTFINEALSDCGLPLLKTGLKA